MRLTHVGGPTLLIEAAGRRLLTDPTFDAPGRSYRFGWGTGSVKTAGPAIAAEDVGPLDAVLLTHDHHEDNLDPAGRALLPGAAAVVTTAAGARRLGAGTIGLVPWTSAEVGGICVTATPCRHGPPLSRPIVGDVIGFALELEGRTVWISGDTVLYDGVREVAERLRVDIAVVHLGGVRFPVTGPLRYTMTGDEAAELLGLLRPQVAIPIHYEGWKHFREGRAAAEPALAGVPGLRWLQIGAPTEL
jgi:L-ascorbate metabolism protein UlaG (beta-lactamase superfamily)